MANKIAFNPEDRFLLTYNNTLIIINKYGEVFGQDVLGATIQAGYKFNAPPVASNDPRDRFVVILDSKPAYSPRIVVITQGGEVFGHDLNEHVIGAWFKYIGPPVASNIFRDRFVVVMNKSLFSDMLIVITSDGEVFGHDISDYNIGAWFKFNGAKVEVKGLLAKFVVTMGKILLVITAYGAIIRYKFVHQTRTDVLDLDFQSLDYILPGEMLYGSIIELSDARFVVAMGNMLIVTTHNGNAFGYEINDLEISPPVWLNDDTPPVPVPVTLTLTHFACLDQSDENRILFGINTSDDEPYALVFAVDLMLNPAPVGAINSKITLVGPIEDVNIETVSASNNIIWGLNNAAGMISSADNLIVIAVMMENDSGSPSQVRTVLEGAAQGAMATNMPAFVSHQIDRQELVNRIISAINGSMGLAKVAAPDPDDNIGLVQELRFYQFELDAVYKQRPIVKSLTFDGDDAKYVLYFKLFR